MGPPPCGGGKHQTSLSFRCDLFELQWGRLHAEAERSAPPLTSTSCSRLQWGRLHAEAESERRRALRAMEQVCFNGAASMRRRKGAMSEIVQELSRRLQWGRLHAEAERPNLPRTATHCHIRFNGAASMRRRKDRPTLLAHPREHRFNGAASMRRRKDRPTLLAHPREHRFNGAASMRRRKERPLGSFSDHDFTLQWGRLHAEAESPQERRTHFPARSLQWGRLHAEAERPPPWSTRYPPSRELQWGRLHAEAESCGSLSWPDPNSALQWGRLHAEAESHLVRGEGEDRAGASMGPPPCGGGKLPRVRSRARQPAASMGPPPCGGGKPWDRVLRGPFTGTLQWGRLHAEAESVNAAARAAVYALASMGPPPCGGGKIPSDSRTAWTPIGFNGAASMRRRKGGRRRRALEVHVPASMGPPPCGGGKTAAKRGFFAVYELQWGRLHAEAERAHRRVEHPGVLQASMGPPPCGGGKPTSTEAPGDRQSASMGPPPCGGGKGMVAGRYRR